MRGPDEAEVAEVAEAAARLADAIVSKLLDRTEIP